VRFENASLRYSRRAPWILTGVDLTLNAGQVAVVLGRNGAGKTTLLSAAAGLLRPDQGRIVDRPGRVGWVPERFPAGQPYRVRSYLVGMGRIRGLRAAAASAEVDRWASRLHLEPYLDVRLAELSKGTAQKVGLIQALVARPDLLVLDEPWEGLDKPTRQEVPEIIAEMLANGGAVLVSDHLGEVERLPDAVHWHVRDGRVRPELPPVRQVPPVRQKQAAQRWVIEVGAAESDVSATVAKLRSDGHQVLGVRPEGIAAGRTATSTDVGGLEEAR
jgi:ABC-2 type transport system ATP-binding protein